MISRRALLAGGCVAAFDCSRRESSGSAEPGARPSLQVAEVDGGTGRPDSRLVEWAFPEQEPERAVVVVPGWGSATDRFPVVVALHGRGESLKSPADGAMGWPRDYELVRAIRRLRSLPLTKKDFEGLIDDADLAATNADLSSAPYRGLIVACPYVPDLDLTQTDAITRYGRFVQDSLLPRTRRETPALASARATGIDGVSLGGAVALHVGLANPLAFGAVGATQPAIHVEDVPLWTERAVSARRKNPDLKLRLLTSQEDYFRDAITRTSQAWRAAGVPHDFAVAAGPHDYVFNRGPGSIQMLRWYDRALGRS
jgi:acetyl esterase/lipase